MTRLIATALFAMAATTAIAFAHEASPISPAGLKKILNYVDTVGTKQTFPAPTAASLGLSNDASQDLPVVSVRTSDQMVYFCRSELNPADYVIWVHLADDKSSSYMFSTHADFKLIRALYTHTDSFPELRDVNLPEVRAAYEKALAALARVVEGSPAAKE